MSNTHTTLNALFTEIANAIREKTRSINTIIADTFPTEIENLRTGFDYNNQEVTIVPDYAFYGCEDLNNVNCYNITSVGASAFENCINLKTIILYDSVTSVGENAFKDCNNVIIYYKGTSIPDTWHENWNPDNRPVLCGELVETWGISATEEDNVTAELFSTADDKSTLFIYGNGNIKNYSSSSLVPWYSSYRTNITSVIIDDSVTSIGNIAFSNCTGLTSITIPDSVTSIGNIAFSNCTSLTSITIPDSVTSIGNYTFRDCTGLTSITIPDSVTSIGESAFSGCTGLTSITIPDSVTSIGGYAFSGCSGLTSVHITDLTAWCSIKFDNYTSNPVNCAHNLYLNDELITELIIPDSVTSISNSAFYNCTGLTSITIPDSVTSIGNWTFSGCTGLTSITIPDSVTSIGGSTFNGCTSLTSINIPDSVTSIGNSAFYNCTGLTSITIPDSVTNIGNYTFQGCTGLTSINIPDSVTSIGQYTFQGCTGLTSITYTGTITQWKAITFGNNWKHNTGNYTIHCTDGDIAKDGTITYHTTT